MKFKQVLAGLLVGTMVVTSAPVSGLGALSALAASEEAETKNYNYTKLTEGLTASADCADGTNTMNAVLNGNPDDYWHSAWEGDNQPVKQGGEVIMNSNNNITLTLTEASTVKKLEYVSNGAGNNGTIKKCNIYYKTSAENAEFKKVQEDPYTLSFTESKATIEFTDAISDVKEIKIEVLNTAGNPNNTFISGKELYVYRDDNTKIDSGNILAKAECSSQGDAALKNLVDNNEATGYHSSWGGNGGTVAADEGFTEIVRPGTMTTPTELISRNNLYINLAGSETIGKIAYLPRQGSGSGNGVANGRITAANIYISNADVNDVSAITDWKQVATADWENNSDEKNVTFSPETAKHIRIEVKHSAGDQTDAYINAAAIDIYKAEEVVAEDKVISKPVLTAVAPVTGETPADVTAAEPEGYTVATAWADSDGNTVTKFEDGKDYTLTATLTAEKGYKFTDESKPSTIKVGEEDLEVTAEVKDSGKTMTLTLVFSVPAETTKPSDKEYGKLEGLTGKADSVETKSEDGAINNALDGNVNTYWHTNWSDSSKPKATYADGKLTGNNTYTITLAKATKVKAFTYIPRNHYDKEGNIANGAISECKVFVSTDNGVNWTLAGTVEGDAAWTYVKKDAEGADQNFVEKTLEFGTEYANVTDVKVEVIKTAGAEANMFINAAEFGVIGEKDAVPVESEARKALAAALADAEKVESADKYTEDSYKTFKEAWDAANAVTDETKDEDVQTIADTLANAIKALKKAETPAPPVAEDSVITAPRLSYTAPVAGETAVVPSYVAMEDQSAKPATLEVKDDVPTTVVVDGGVLAFQGRLTAPNNGANNDKFDVSGDTPMVLRTKVKLNNKTDEVVNILGKMDSQYGIQVDGANDRVILYCCDAQGKWPEIQYKYDADTFWGEWHDIALVYTGTNMQLYVDGKAGEATPGRVNASDGYQVVFKSYASSIFTIGYNTEKSTNHEADGNGVKYSTLDQVDGKIADIKLYKGTDYSEGLTKSYNEIKAALEKVAPDADISAIPYTAVTTWSANGTALEKDAKFAGETVYTATTVYTAPSGFKFTDISKPSVDGATVTISADGKTMTVTKAFPKTAKIVCSCVVGEITGVADQTIDLGVADSKTVTLSAKAQVTGDCKVEGHDGTVNYTYTVTDAGTTGATVKDNAVTVTAAGTAKVKVTATLASDATKTSTKEITLTVTTNKASAQDKADLVAAINAVKDIKEADYTEESYAPLKTALATADTLSKDANASKSDIAAAIQAISDAKKGLKTKVAAKKEELNSLLTAVYDDLMANGNKYTVASYNNAVTVYKAVKDVPGKDGVTVAELEKAIKDLNDAKDALVLQETADLEKAKENAANTLKDAAAIADAGQKDYEEASWKVFDAAYKALKNAPADADKATLESLTLALRNAQAALKKAETPAVALDAPKVKAAKAKVTKTGVVVNVTVEAVKDAASYDVYRVVKGKATKVGTTAAGKTTVKDKKAVKGASYYAVAVSKDGKVVSKAGAAVAVKLAKAPKIQKATAGSKNAKLSWKKVKGAKVVVYRSTKKNSGYKKVATTRKNATSVTNKKGLKAGKTYYYKIATIKGKLISAMSKAKRVKIKK
ncbi:discoidin domain-containing protein [Lachnospiraceae bacterium CLA-AA-H246]|uniref:Discoidin domain-containing protein n=1 Tax=Hominisplanchenecus faecis TaxID=2885351 RepID=A0ABS8ESH9_9FIRM|nr:discoidin domain-containing protein [Hominisplanchenecus faecis]MCC2148085.1 discoidin domain-containing protein [Hominisplanchenecus faecis]